MGLREFYKYVKDVFKLMLLFKAEPINDFTLTMDQITLCSVKSVAQNDECTENDH